MCTASSSLGCSILVLVCHITPLTIPNDALTIVSSDDKAMLYYDYILTFPEELQYIWRSGCRMRSSTLLYVCCRYAIPGNLVLLLVNVGVLSRYWYLLSGILSIIGRAAVLSE